MQILTRLALLALLIAPLTMVPNIGQAEETEAVTEETVEVVEVEVEEKKKSVAHRILFYIPNRAFDVFDIVRARIRFGPGVAVDARVTKYGDFFAGAYTSFFIGIPGPRTEPRIPWPAGIESRAGVSATAIADITTLGPNYGYGEVGAGVHALFLGVDVGVDPIEALDLVLGFLFIDLTGDDF
jgi:hypothetical protein